MVVRYDFAGIASFAVCALVAVAAVVVAVGFVVDAVAVKMYFGQPAVVDYSWPESVPFAFLALVVLVVLVLVPVAAAAEFAD